MHAAGTGETRYDLALTYKTGDDADASQLHRFSHVKDLYMWQAQARHNMTWPRPIRLVMLEYDADVSQLHKFSRAKGSHMRQAQARRDIAWN